MKFIDLQTQYKKIKDDIDLAVQLVLDHGFYVNGPEISKLEKKLKAFIGVNHCISVANGTDALEIAQKAIDIKDGDEVIVPSFTWVSTAETVKYLGGNPIFCDVDINTFNISVEDAASKITKKTKAIVAVSLFGQCADLHKLKMLCDDNKIYLIEDGAQSFGASHGKSMSCSVAHISTTSFFPSKPLGCYGDGGAVFTNDDELEERMRLIARHGQSGKDDFSIVGRNSRLDTIQAAILLEKLKIFEFEIERRNIVHEKYMSNLKNSCFKTPHIKGDNRSVFAQYTLKGNPSDIKKAQLELSNKNIPFVSYYEKPLHLQEAYVNRKKIKLENTEVLSTSTISLPMSPYLTTEEIEYISAIMCDI